MESAHRDLRLILLGIIIAWGVYDLKNHNWTDLFMVVIFMLIFGRLVWPINIFDRSNGNIES